MASNGGRATGCIRANGLLPAAGGVGARPGSVHTPNELSAGIEPCGYVVNCVASPPGWSSRIAHVFPRPPGLFELKNRYLPSADHCGFELSVLGDVQRSGWPPALFTTQISLWRRFSLSRTVVTVIAMRLPSGDTAGALTVESRYQSASIMARGPLGSRVDVAGAAASATFVPPPRCAASGLENARDAAMLAARVSRYGCEDNVVCGCGDMRGSRWRGRQVAGAVGGRPSNCAKSTGGVNLRAT